MSFFGSFGNLTKQPSKPLPSPNAVTDLLKNLGFPTPSEKQSDGETAEKTDAQTAPSTADLIADEDLQAFMNGSSGGNSRFASAILKPSERSVRTTVRDERCNGQRVSDVIVRTIVRSGGASVYSLHRCLPRPSGWARGHSNLLQCADVCAVVGLHVLRLALPCKLLRADPAQLARSVAHRCRCDNLVQVVPFHRATEG